jgi:hypothetical protein
VTRVDTSAALEQTANGLGTPRANRAMQWSRARLVLVLEVRPGVEEALDHRSLFGRIPHLSGLGPRIARVVKRGCATPILGVRVSSGFDERPDGERPERGGREMERRIADVQLMRNFLHEPLFADARLRDLGRRSDEPHGLGFVRDDRSEELGKNRHRHIPSVVSQQRGFITTGWFVCP